MMKVPEPRASRPKMPKAYGILGADKGGGLLPWAWARKRLLKSRNYWIVTAHRSGRPHAMPVWGVWLNDVFYFSTGRRSQKERNLAANPRCIVLPENATEAVVVRGLASKASSRSRIRQVAMLYKAKYREDLDPKLGPIFAVRPKLVFGLIGTPEDFAGTATRWRF